MHSRRFSGRLLLVAVAACASVSSALGQASKMKRVEGNYHVIHSDLPAPDLREAKLRMTVMAELYNSRTKGFAGKITRKLPFYLYNNATDYYRAGGIPGSAGVFNGEKLMAIADDALGDEVWHTIQHEGFHQFVHAVIGGDIPIWVNEGLAEYFGEAIWTGDSYVPGVVPEHRRQRIAHWIKPGNVMTVKGMMTLEHSDWNAQLHVANYDQAWSMVHFLAHAKGGKYTGAFDGFLRSVSNGKTWETAWIENFGQGVKEFEKQWRDYWSKMEANSTRDVYAKASVATLTSFLGRAMSQKQTFESFDEFMAAAKAGKLKAAEDDWLPRSLLDRELRRAPRLGDWTLARRGNLATLTCELDDGEKLTGRFQVNGQGGKINRESVTVDSNRK